MARRPSSPLSTAMLGGLGVIAILSHLPAIANGFALDDPVIRDNPALSSLRTLPAVLASPWWYTTNHLYRPLTLATFAIDRAVAGTGAVFPHAINLVLHAWVAVLVARWIARFTSAGPAMFGALAFAVLPVHAEAIASVVGRAELLSALALVALMLHVTDDDPQTRKGRLLAALLGAIALAGKEGGVVAPALAVAAAWTRPAQRPNALRWGIATAAGTALMLTARIAVLGTFGGDAPNPAFRIMAAPERVSTALTILPRMAMMLILPARPAIDFVPTLAELWHPASWMIGAGAAIVALTLFGLVLHLRRPSPVGLAVWVIAATTLPTANLLFASGVVLSGRTLYAPAMGAALLLAVVAERVAATRSRAVRVAVAGAAGCGLVVSAVISWTECSVWRSSDAVIAAMQQRAPGDYRSFLHLAYQARDHGHDAEAIEHFRSAATRFSGDPEMLTDAATVALRVNDTTIAITWLAQAVSLKPMATRARTRLVDVLLARGDSIAPRRLLLDGLREEPYQHLWAAQLRALDSLSSRR